MVTIGIPTYNRAQFINESLESILSQVSESHLKDFRLIISDNASTDNTSQRVNETLCRYPKVSITYTVNPSNIGPDANFAKIIKSAEPGFVFLISDDDILLPGALDKIFAAIEENPRLDAICFNATWFKTGLSPARELRYRLPSDRILSDRDEALEFFGTQITHVSFMAFQRDSFDMTLMEAKVGTSMAQAYAYLSILSKSREILVTALPYLATRVENSGGYNFYEVFVTNYGNLINFAHVLGFKKKITEKVKLQHLAFLRGYTLKFKKQGAIGGLKPQYWDGYMRVLRLYGSHFGKTISLGLILLLPRAIVVVASAIWSRASTLKKHRYDESTKNC
jgi:abequosyltransferase